MYFEILPYILFHNINGNQSNFDHFVCDFSQHSHLFHFIGASETNIAPCHMNLHNIPEYISEYKLKDSNKNTGCEAFHLLKKINLYSVRRNLQMLKKFIIFIYSSYSQMYHSLLVCYIHHLVDQNLKHWLNLKMCCKSYQARESLLHEILMTTFLYLVPSSDNISFEI